MNPSYAINVNTISSRAPSTTQPTLHGLQRCVVHNENDYNARLDFCQPCFSFFEKLFSISSRLAVSAGRKAKGNQFVAGTITLAAIRFFDGFGIFAIRIMELVRIDV